MKIAIAGSGISGMLSAYLLAAEHDVTLFEREDRLGGHTNTLRVRHEGTDFAVDTGFIVFNERNYPSFTKLLRQLGVDSRPTTMSFSLCDPARKFAGVKLSHRTNARLSTKGILPTFVHAHSDRAYHPYSGDDNTRTAFSVQILFHLILH